MFNINKHGVYIKSGSGGKDMKIVLTALLGVFLSFGLYACTGRIEDNASFNNIQSVYDEFSLDRISEIKVTNGNNGNRMNVTDTEQIENIFDAFSKLSIKDTEQPKEDSSGYSYGIGFYNDDKKVLSVVYGSVTDTLLINRHLYIVEDKSVIQSAIDYFDENTG